MAGYVHGSGRRPWPDEVRERAVAMKEAGATYREITVRLGVSRGTVCQWVNDPGGARLAARQDAYRGTCVECGAKTTGCNGRDAAPERCASCVDQRVWTRETIVAALREFRGEFGRPPSAADFGSGNRATVAARRYVWESRRWPRVASVQREFGSWNAALEAAGFDTVDGGHKRSEAVAA